jgi:hypothetical protein
VRIDVETAFLFALEAVNSVMLKLHFSLFGKGDVYGVLSQMWEEDI